MHTHTLVVLFLFFSIAYGQELGIEDDYITYDTDYPTSTFFFTDTSMPPDTEGTTFMTTGTTTTSPDDCPEPYERVGEFCFHFNLAFPQSWLGARDYCRGIGGDLAVLHTCELFGQVVRHIHLSGQEVPDGYSYWVGGSDEGDEGAWYWVDGVQMAMGVPFWGMEHDMEEPSGNVLQNCAHLDSRDRYYIHDGECNLGAFPLCMYDVYYKN